MGGSTYTPLIVDYHENQFLEQHNNENALRLKDPDFHLPTVPTNSIAFDRYAYSLNNPIRFVDPTGHFAILAALALIPPAGLVLLGVAAVATCVYFAVPEVRPAVTNAISQTGQSLSDAVSEFAKKRDLQEIDWLLEEAGLSRNDPSYKDIRRKVHDQITGQHLSLEEIRKRIQDELLLRKKTIPTPPPVVPEEEDPENGES